MPFTVEVEIKGANKLIALAERFPKVAEPHINLALRRSFVHILNEVKKPSGAPVDTGQLRDRWAIDIGRFMGQMVSMARSDNGALYGIFVHEGTRPHFPPPRALERWSLKRGLNPFAVAKSIAKKGTKPNPFLQRSVKGADRKINNEFQTAIKNTLNDLVR